MWTEPLSLGALSVIYAEAQGHRQAGIIFERAITGPLCDLHTIVVLPYVGSTTLTGQPPFTGTPKPLPRLLASLKLI